MRVARSAEIFKHQKFDADFNAKFHQLLQWLIVCLVLVRSLVQTPLMANDCLSGPCSLSLAVPDKAKCLEACVWLVNLVAANLKVFLAMARVAAVFAKDRLHFFEDLQGAWAWNHSQMNP